MKKELTINEIEEIKNNEWLVFSTTNSNLEPRAIIVMPSKVEKDRIILSNIQMNKSVENILNNPKCFIDVYIKELNDKQIKIKGTAKVYDSEELFEEIKQYEETNNLPADLKVNSIIDIVFDGIEITEG